MKRHDRHARVLRTNSRHVSYSVPVREQANNSRGPVHTDSMSSGPTSTSHISTSRRHRSAMNRSPNFSSSISPVIHSSFPVDVPARKLLADDAK